MTTVILGRELVIIFRIYIVLGMVVHLWSKYDFSGFIKHHRFSKPYYEVNEMSVNYLFIFDTNDLSKYCTF